MKITASKSNVQFLVDSYCVLSEGEYILPPHNGACYHHDYNTNWENAVALALVKQESHPTWKYVHRVTERGRKTIQAYLINQGCKIKEK